MIVKLHESFSIKKKAANCASAYLYQGAYRCYGDGVDVTRIIFSWSVFSNGTRKREICDFSQPLLIYNKGNYSDFIIFIF